MSIVGEQLLEAMSQLSSSEPWMGEAVCAQTSPDDFFPEKGGNVRAAKRICFTCPVIQECRDYALDTDQRWGVWGATTARERMRLRRAS